MTGKLKAVPIAAAVLAALVVGSVAIAGGPGGHESAGDRHAASAGSTEPAERDDDSRSRDDDAGEADEQVKDQATSDRARAAALGRPATARSPRSSAPTRARAATKSMSGAPAAPTSRSHSIAATASFRSRATTTERHGSRPLQDQGAIG